ncbi:conserved virulence factor C family protein [Metabacillus sp. GX 13764]|uniref:conserved virulence factor C family protein n=1 Tax=Metabacillus kandeliae TaxID=2900151 RepID=UPI001E3FCCA0|nr:conserved virulence factor C family protein [Metabacillus kandeliae]MCD7033450.1 conserved virulence factor C family protein [Metabacillus kandeliae]
MKIVSIEPTPSPNTMKILLDEELPAGKSSNYKKDQREEAPEIIGSILAIDGVKGVYHVADFLAVERNAKFDWKEILPKVRNCFGEDEHEAESGAGMLDGFGEIRVFIQFFNGIPMQIKLSDSEEERRYPLAERFQQAILDLQNQSANVVLNREWKEQGVRYGDFDEIGKDVAEEISAAYSPERLKRLASKQTEKESGMPKPRSAYPVSLEMLDEPDWRTRYAHMDQMEPDLNSLPILNKALDDEKASIRRLAAVYLGMIEDQAVLPYLYKALTDKSVTVRRTAGDCLSDLGFEEAEKAMMDALKDSSKLVRWRAAMFLYETGTDQSLAALKEAEDDPEFEVSLQVKMAIERIQGGEEAKGSVWKQMTESRQRNI